ncbi:MAG: transposase domain-containing protein [Eubacterium sp.]
MKKPYPYIKNNWMTMETPRGAEANAIVYSLVKSALANHLKPYHYFSYLLTAMPNLDLDPSKEALDDFMPWSKVLPQIAIKRLRQLRNNSKNNQFSVNAQVGCEKLIVFFFVKVWRV